MKPWLLMILLLQVLFSSAQKKVQFDSSFIESRSFNQQAIQQFKNDKAFQYEHKKEPVQSLWQRFWTWIWYKVNDILSTRSGRNTMWILFIVFAVSTIVFFVLKLTGMNKDGLFGRSSDSHLDYNVDEENIHTISFDDAIEEAVTNKNYRLAIRLLYLRCLKKMTDSGLIDWQINKTNNDYLREVQGRQWAGLFSSVTNHFNYAWYGEVDVDEESFKQVKEQFVIFDNQLQH